MPHEATRRFEAALCEYTGAPYAVSVSSCTQALELALRWVRLSFTEVTIPRRTYVGVPQAAIRAGYRVLFSNAGWSGAYRLWPTPVWDCAKRFTSGMYVHGEFQCLSFHVAKILGDSQGGAVLTHDPEAARWMRKIRFDGRTEGVPLKDDKDILMGMHCYMSPDVANRLHARLKSHSFPKHNPDQCPEGFLQREYGDLSSLECFKPYVVR